VCVCVCVYLNGWGMKMSCFTCVIPDCLENYMLAY